MRYIVTLAVLVGALATAIGAQAKPVRSFTLAQARQLVQRTEGHPAAIQSCAWHPGWPFGPTAVCFVRVSTKTSCVRFYDAVARPGTRLAIVGGSVVSVRRGHCPINKRLSGGSA